MIFAKSIFALLASGAQSSEQEKVALIQLPNQELLAVDVDKPLRASLLSAGLTAKASVDATAKASVDASGEITLKTQGSTPVGTHCHRPHVASGDPRGPSLIIDFDSLLGV